MQPNNPTTEQPSNLDFDSAQSADRKEQSPNLPTDQLNNLSTDQPSDRSHSPLADRRPSGVEAEAEVLVRVEGVSKKFCKDLKTSLKYGVQDLTAQIFGKEQKKELRPKEFWAVKEVSFELRRGECLGLIGHNGAGKSTLLKMLNGLINPDEGRIEMYGRVAALIELGAGFNPTLTGRENIYNNGAVLGISRNEIDAVLEEIIDFAELREFIDTPVQNYSSGMKVRLGFAIASQMKPDVLIIDEVLAVGDLGFILKCFKRIDYLLPNTAVIFVSHSMPMVSRICNEIILMEHGKPLYQGREVAKGIDRYYARFSQSGSNVIFTDNSIELTGVKINDSIEELPQINWNEDISVILEFKNFTLSTLPFITLSIFDKEQRGVAVFHTAPLNKEIEKGSFAVEIKHKNLQLSKGIYSLNVSLAANKGSNPLLRINGITSFQLTHEEQTWPPFLLEAEIQSYNI